MKTLNENPIIGALLSCMSLMIMMACTAPGGQDANVATSEEADNATDIYENQPEVQYDPAKGATLKFSSGELAGVSIRFPADASNDSSTIFVSAQPDYSGFDMLVSKKLVPSSTAFKVETSGDSGPLSKPITVKLPYAPQLLLNSELLLAGSHICAALKTVADRTIIWPTDALVFGGTGQIVLTSRYLGVFQTFVCAAEIDLAGIAGVEIVSEDVTGPSGQAEDFDGTPLVVSSDETGADDDDDSTAVYSWDYTFNLAIDEVTGSTIS